MIENQKSKIQSVKGGGKEKGLISIIMPAYNAASFIGPAIDSVLWQTYQNFELVIVDDGSTDDTKRIVQSYTDPRINLFSLDRNMGRGFARNFAVSKCKGEFVAIFDADDISDKNRLKLQADFLNRNADISIVSGQLAHLSDQDAPRKIYSFPQSKEEVKVFFQKGVMGVAHAACMLRAECFETMRYEDAIAYNVEDFELFLRLSHFFAMASLPEILVQYRNKISRVPFSRIKHHTLYHYYSIYLANKKLAGKEYQGFEEWSVKQKKSLKLNVSAASVFMKLRIKQAVRRFL